MSESFSARRVGLFLFCFDSSLRPLLLGMYVPKMPSPRFVAKSPRGFPLATPITRYEGELSIWPLPLFQRHERAEYITGGRHLCPFSFAGDRRGMRPGEGASLCTPAFLSPGGLCRGATDEKGTCAAPQLGEFRRPVPHLNLKYAVWTLPSFSV